ncbi:hypothetical protein HYALB_00010135 [Hymenoscyphus albidus]|uniref:DUF7918 domain-containing protein n=1 Tax=Hymenoscyphus albidus TaxID=595503 RepID=A0A9N9PWY9_9HELO|nr:hypothetical protein HYALB_00010135 [Hymenoscyphus albidus]
MAILEGLPGIQVTIESDGKTLDEYPDDEDFKFREYTAPEKAMSTVFVPCVSDAAFSIRLRTTQEYVPSLPPNGPHHDGLLFHASPVLVVLDYPEEYVDDANADQIASDIKITNQGLGEIVVVVRRIVYKDHVLKVARRDEKAFENVSQVSEKALKGKAISHGVKFGKGTTVHLPRLRSGKSSDYVDSRSSAMAISFATRNDYPPNSFPRTCFGSTGPVSNAERVARLKREIDLIKAEEEKENRRRGLKRQFKDDDDLQISRAGKSRSRATGAKVEMIDLTDD